MYYYEYKYFKCALNISNQNLFLFITFCKNYNNNRFVIKYIIKYIRY